MRISRSTCWAAIARGLELLKTEAREVVTNHLAACSKHCRQAESFFARYQGTFKHELHADRGEQRISDPALLVEARITQTISRVSRPRGSVRLADEKTEYASMPNMCSGSMPPERLNIVIQQS